MKAFDKQQLEHGDLTKIAKVTGYSKDYVNCVLTGKRSAKSKGGKLIVAAYYRIVANHKQMDKLIAEIRNNAINDIEPALYGRENFSNTQVAA
jgi:hypothetical protein